MDHKRRSLQSVIKTISDTFPVLLITGPRQVGKTTLLESCAEETRSYVTLDDLDQREIAQNDPALFLQMHKPPVIIDEVQYAPQLFSYVKMAVDKQKKNGLFWLTGSQKFHLMQGITETLAGRVAIIDMLGLSQAEIENRTETTAPFLPEKIWIEQASSRSKKIKTLQDIYRSIWTGSFPKLALDNQVPRDVFFNSYIQTYIQRDVRSLTNVGNELAFQKFLRACAARTAQLLNYADLAKDVDVDQRTIKNWLSILEASGLIYLLQPYHTNVTKRVIKTPKLHFLDTGLCAYLTQWSTPEALEAGAMSGAILETYIFSEILKSYWHQAKTALLYFYRDHDTKEIDLLIDQNNTLYPIEFKKTATPSQTATKSFSALEKLGRNIGPGAVICLKETIAPLSMSVTSIPVGVI